jgi:16S rRNA C1402 (ribose-2'-O) methylase RsmI
MYKCILHEITRFKAVMTMYLSELRSKLCFYESSTRMDNLLRSLVCESQKRTILCHWRSVVTNGIKVIVQPEIGEAYTSP